MLKELKKNKMSVVATGILFGVMGVLIIPMIAVIVKISNALSQKHPMPDTPDDFVGDGNEGMFAFKKQMRL